MRCGSFRGCRRPSCRRWWESSPRSSRTAAGGWRRCADPLSRHCGRPAEPQRQGDTMRFMMFVRANKNIETGALPTKELVAAMGRFNAEMMKAGVLLAAEGLQPSSKGARITFSRATRSVTDGPFPDKELVSGFWMIQGKSKSEAVEWARRVPFAGGEVAQIRQGPQPADFPAGALLPGARRAT